LLVDAPQGRFFFDITLGFPRYWGGGGWVVAFCIAGLGVFFSFNLCECLALRVAVGVAFSIIGLPIVGMKYL